MRPQLPEGVQQGTYAVRPTSAGTVEIDVREFIGWWDTEQNNFIKQVRDAKPSHIKLSIASHGGFWDDALAIHEFLKGYPATVESEVMGTTASAATIIALAADKGRVRISSNSLFLIHYTRYGLFAFGEIEDIEKATDEALRAHRKFNQVTLGIYQKHTGRSEDELDALLKANEWLTAEEALAWGLVDEIFEPAPDDSDANDKAENSTRGRSASSFRATCHALNLPELPASPSHKPKLLPSTLAAMKPEKTKTESDAPAKTPEATASAPKPDETDRLAHMEAELKRLKEDNAAVKAENDRLAKERRESALNALKTEMVGRLPGTAVDEAVAFARAVDEAVGGRLPGTELGVIDQFKGIIASMPEHGLTRTIDTEPVADEDAEAMAEAVKAM